MLTASKPERTFVSLLCRRENADALTAWIKSPDQKFYEISYSCRYGSGDSKSRKYYHDKFNPDFFLRVEKGGVCHYIVVEIKEDGDVSEENRAKYRYAVEHFAQLNRRLEETGAAERYRFHFLSPDGYDAFFSQLRDGTLLEGEGQGKFRCPLENALEAAETA